MNISSYDVTNIKNFIRMIPFLITPSREIKYPEYWEHQTEEIQTFSVDKTTKEFKDIQDKFYTVGTIQELLRIQNKIVYKKYYDEKNWLKELNEGKEVLEAMLYHGTRGTDPEIIYGDKEESFNINYTSDRNYLGKGTYFAVNPTYSHNYSYSYKEQEKTGILNYFGRQSNSYKRAMFYCSVLIGDSQKIHQVTQQSQDMKDTDYKNKDKKIRYESSTTFTAGSDVYAVYKNRRAYPSYLIKYWNIIDKIRYIK